MSSEHLRGKMGDAYDGDYFLRGRESGKSLYCDYRWMPDLTILMAQRIVDHCGIHKGERVLDFGCARGYLVRALRGLGYDARGIDVSAWAIDNVDDKAKPHCGLVSGAIDDIVVQGGVDWVVAKDVLEHVPSVGFVIDALMNLAVSGLFVVVPLSKFDGGKYVVEEYEKDVTHIQRYRLATWVELFLKEGWRVEASYKVPGIKDNYAQHTYGNGFITARRIL